MEKVGQLCSECHRHGSHNTIPNVTVFPDSLKTRPLKKSAPLAKKMSMLKRNLRKVLIGRGWLHLVDVLWRVCEAGALTETWVSCISASSDLIMY